MIRDRVIVCLASRWDYDPTSKHQVMRILARENDVVWVNHRGSRRPRATAADLGAMVSTVGLMVWAIYASIRANDFGIEYVPFWWFLWAASTALFIAFYGLNSVAIKAYPPFALGQGNEGIKFGHQAVREGWQYVIGGLLGAGVFAALAIYVGVTGVDWFEQFITGVVIFCVGLGLIAALGNIIRSLRRR